MRQPVDTNVLAEPNPWTREEPVVNQVPVMSVLVSLTN